MDKAEHVEVKSDEDKLAILIATYRRAIALYGVTVMRGRGEQQGVSEDLDGIARAIARYILTHP